MTFVTSSGVSSSARQQAGKLALLAKLFQTTGKSAESGKTRRKSEAAVPPPPPPVQTNSAAGLASMFEALQNGGGNSVSDLPSRLLQAVDSDGDGAISADELQAVTETGAGQPPKASPPSLYLSLVRTGDVNGGGVMAAANVAASPVARPSGQDFAVVAPDGNDGLSQTELDQFAALRTRAAAAPDAGNMALIPQPGRTATGYEALFQALQLVFAEAGGPAGPTPGQRYTDLLQSLAKAA